VDEVFASFDATAAASHVRRRESLVSAARARGDRKAGISAVLERALHGIKFSFAACRASRDSHPRGSERLIEIRGFNGPRRGLIAQRSNVAPEWCSGYKTYVSRRTANGTRRRRRGDDATRMEAIAAGQSSDTVSARCAAFRSASRASVGENILDLIRRWVRHGETEVATIAQTCQKMREETLRIRLLLVVSVCVVWDHSDRSPRRTIARTTSAAPRERTQEAR